MSADGCLGLDGSLDWLPNAEGFVLPGAAHFLQLENPSRVAEALAGFYARHRF